VVACVMGCGGVRVLACSLLGAPIDPLLVTPHSAQWSWCGRARVCVCRRGNEKQGIWRQAADREGGRMPTMPPVRAHSVSVHAGWLVQASSRVDYCCPR
jgi:hypothetical protein